MERNLQGELGTYQKLFLLLVCSAAINSGLNSLDYVFTRITPPFRCDVKGIDHLAVNFSFDELSHLASPVTERGSVDACLMYQYNYSTFTLEDTKLILESENATLTSTTKCDRWIFNKDEDVETIVTEWNLVCGRELIVATSQAVYMVGAFTIFIGGILGDRFGRRPVGLGCVILMILCRILIATSPNVYVYMIARLLLACSGYNWYTNLCVYAMENVGPSKRALAGLIPYIFATIGFMITTGMAYFIKNWRTRNISYLIFTLPYLLHFCFLRESVRWLKTRNRNEDAIKGIKIIARVNQVNLPDDVLSEMHVSKLNYEEKEKRPGFSSLFKSWVLIRITLIEIAIWMSVNAIYHGLTYYITDLAGNIYLNTFTSAVLEQLALFYVYMTMDTRLGRKYNAVLMFLMAGCVLLALIFVPMEINWLRTSLAQIGRLCASALFSIIYIATAEIFPTRIRTAGLSLCSSVSRVASVISPYFDALNKFGPFVIPLLFGGLSICAALLYLLLPETRGKVLEDFNVQVESKPSQKLFNKINNDIVDTKETTEALVGKDEHVKTTKI